MKRIISLCCVALIFVFSLAAPASATETEAVFTDLLDFGYVNNLTSNFYTFNAGTTSVFYNLPSYSNVRYIDILFRSSGGAPSQLQAVVGNVTVTLTLVSLGDALYRAYGRLTSGSDSKVTVNYTCSATNYVEFLKFDVSSYPIEPFVIDSYCQISSVAYENLIHYVPTDSINYRLFDATNMEAYDSAFTLTLYVDDWQKYDYIDFSLLCAVQSITSIGAFCGDNIIPVDYNTTENSSYILPDFQIYARIDLTGIDRTTSDTPCLRITGQWSPGWVNTISMLGTNAFICTGENVPERVWYLTLKSIIQNGFNNMSTWFTNQTSAIQTQFTQLKTSISSNFTNLNTWIKNQTTSIVNAINGDTAPGDQFQDEVQEELDELDQAQAVMDSVTKPAIEDIDVSVDQYVSQADIEVLATPMAVFFEGEIFSKVIIMSILLATVSYTLYGKK